MNLERSLKIVRGHAPIAVPDAAARAGLTAAVAMVLRTHRSDADDMVLDHELWLTCMNAVTRTVSATKTEVFDVAERRWLERLRRPVLGPRLGSLDDYGQRLRDDLARGEHDSGAWGTVLWWKDAAVVASASCEAWFAVGGPAPYHDSYTSSVLVDPRHVDALLREVRESVRDVGGWVEEVVD